MSIGLGCGLFCLFFGKCLWISFIGCLNFFGVFRLVFFWLWFVLLCMV